ncbi:MAG: hypothetical protein B6D64_10735, partial [Bacteroidetes bacterium 4484_276]
DFSSEVERSLRVLDGAILVVSAVEAVQAHTYTLWDALQEMKVPTLIFINKLDRHGADFENVLSEFANELHANVFPLDQPVEEGSNNANINPLWGKNNNEALTSLQELAIENLAGLDEEVLERYLEGDSLTDDFIFEKLKSYTSKNKAFPVLCGVAKNGIGMETLLDVVVGYLPAAKASGGELSALVYKIESHPKHGRLAHVRLFGGGLRNRDLVKNFSQKTEAKVARVMKHIAGKIKDIDVLRCGDTGILTGMQNVVAGDILGQPNDIPGPSALQIPFLTTRVKPVSDDQYIALAEALAQLDLEDPNLDFKWYKSEKELHLKLMGKIQMEVLQSMIKSRFDVDVVFEKPIVIYKETPGGIADGHASYTMPKPCWAVLRFKIEPGERGSGIQYKSEVSVDRIHQKYQNEIEQAIPKALQQGIKGWEVTDIKITLIDGEDHVVHSRPGDFIIAVPMALMDALTNSGTSLLEPMMHFEIKAGEEHFGNISGDLHAMRAEFANPEFDIARFTLHGTVPASTSMDYSIRLNSLTGGKGKLRLSFAGYKPCPDEQGQTRPYRGVNPMDRSRWILHARGAFKADERKM